MPKLNSRGDVAHGIGGGLLNVNNAAIRAGGSPGWFDDDRVAFIDGTIGWIPSLYDPRSNTFTKFDTPGANQLHAAAGLAAWMLNTAGEERGVYASDGFRARDAGLMWIGRGGQIVYKPQYHSHGPTMVRERDGSEWQLTPGTAISGTVFVRGGSIHLEADNRTVVSTGLGDVKVENSGGIWMLEAAFAGGQYWLGYYSGARGIVLHPRDSLVGFSILPKGDGWPTFREISDRIIRVAISTTEGEQAGHIWIRDFDVIANAVRDPWGDGKWIPTPRVDLLTVNATPVEPEEPRVDNGWFPRINRGGEIVSGQGFVTHRGKKILDPGYKPKWRTDDRIVAMGAGDEIFEFSKDGSNVQKIHGVPLNHVFGAGGGKFKAAAPGEIWIEFDPVNGNEVVVVEHGGSNNDRGIRYGGQMIVDHVPVNEARAFDGLVLWRQWPMPSGIRGWQNGRMFDLRTLANDWEGNPVPIKTDQGWWFAFMTNVDIRVRPLDSFEGYIIETGEDKNFHPDAMGLGSKIRLTWNTNQGERFSRDIALSDARVDTRKPITVKPVDPIDPVEPEEPKAMKYRDGGEIEAHLTKVWNEMRVPERTKALHDRGVTDEHEYKAVQVPALVRAAGELHHGRGWKDVGLSTKNGGNRWTLPDGRNIATDIITLKPIDDQGRVVDGNFALSDAIVSVGDHNSRPTWNFLGPNNDPSRPWMEPPVPEGIIVDPEEPGDTHRYIGGGNDTGTCDVCQRPKLDAVHRVPEGKKPHEPWQGEDGRGDCDLCFQPVDADIHRKDEPAMSNIEARDYFFSLIGKAVGQPADDWQAVLRSLKARGMRVNAIPNERPRADWPFRGISVVFDDGGRGNPRGTIQLPTSEPDSNGFFTHEYQIIADRASGQEPFVGPFNYAWIDRGGPTVVLGPVVKPEEPEEPTVENHDFVGTGRFCGECGKPKTDPIHEKKPVEPGSGGGVSNNLLREMIAEQKITNQKLDELRTGVVNAVRDFGKLLPDILGGGGLIDILRRGADAAEKGGKKKT